MSNKEIYNVPTIELLILDEEDIITTSGALGMNTNGLMDDLGAGENFWS